MKILVKKSSLLIIENGRGLSYLHERCPKSFGERYAFDAIELRWTHLKEISDVFVTEQNTKLGKLRILRRQQKLYKYIIFVIETPALSYWIIASIPLYRKALLSHLKLEKKKHYIYSFCFVDIHWTHQTEIKRKREEVLHMKICSVSISVVEAYLTNVSRCGRELHFEQGCVWNSLQEDYELCTA